MESEVSSTRPVPYCTVKGFRRALEVLRSTDGEQRVDRSLLVGGGLSSHAAYPVLGALRFLGLVDRHGRRTPHLEPFLDEDDVQGRRAVVERAYAAILDDVPFPVEDREEVDRILVERHGCAPGVAAFCSTFFLWLAADGGLPVVKGLQPRRGRPPAHLAQLSRAARALLAARTEAEDHSPFAGDRRGGGERTEATSEAAKGIRTG